MDGLHLPEEPARPGGKPDFSGLLITPDHECPRPAIDVDPHSIHELAYSLVRVMDDQDHAAGPWNPALAPEVLRSGLRYMLRTRLLDERLLKLQRQGTVSFYITCTGEEAVSVGAAMALQREDMLFPTYRQQGLLIAREYPLKAMMCQVLSNACDPLNGKQLPTLYSSKEHGFFSVSGNLATQFSQAVGWAMASALKGERTIAATWIGEGSSAEGDFHQGLLLATVYQAPVILNIVNNQWAISINQNVSGGQHNTFAARGIGYNLPSLRVDGNDFLAVYAATSWAAERARDGHGPSLIELFSYRAGPHSSSDDPSRYRPKDEGRAWPLGDPIERLKRHLVAIGAWTEVQQQALIKDLEFEIEKNWAEAEAFGSIAKGTGIDPLTLFDQVYKEPPPHLRAQREQLRELTCRP